MGLKMFECVCGCLNGSVGVGVGVGVGEGVGMGMGGWVERALVCSLVAALPSPQRVLVSWNSNGLPVQFAV
jgi:hypothetical protein